MSNFTFYKGWQILNELGPMPPPGGLGTPPPPGGLGGPPPIGGPPGLGAPPMGGMGGPPMGGMGGMGDPMGGMGGMGDPMGGGMGGQPIPIKTIPAADAWGVLEKLVKDEKYSNFFQEINIGKNAKPKPKEERQTSFMK